MQPRRPELLSPLSSKVLDVLQDHTMFPWPLLKTQAERHGLDGAALDAEALARLIPELEKGLARFGTTEKAAVAAAALWELARGPAAR